jgi:hypothetical protein
MIAQQAQNAKKNVTSLKHIEKKAGEALKPRRLMRCPLKTARLLVFGDLGFG